MEAPGLAVIVCGPRPSSDLRRLSLRLAGIKGESDLNTAPLKLETRVDGCIVRLQVSAFELLQADFGPSTRPVPDSFEQAHSARFDEKYSPIKDINILIGDPCYGRVGVTSFLSPYSLQEIQSDAQLGRVLTDDKQVRGAFLILEKTSKAVDLLPLATRLAQRSPSPPRIVSLLSFPRTFSLLHHFLALSLKLLISLTHLTLQSLSDHPLVLSSLDLH